MYECMYMYMVWYINASLYMYLRIYAHWMYVCIRIRYDITMVFYMYLRVWYFIYNVCMRMCKCIYLRIQFQVIPTIFFGFWNTSPCNSQLTHTQIQKKLVGITRDWLYTRSFPRIFNNKKNVILNKCHQCEVKTHFSICDFYKNENFFAKKKYFNSP